MGLSVGFFGSAPFVVDFIDAIVASRHRVAFTVTAPDKPRGRGMQLQPTALKERSLSLGIPCLQPDKVRGNDEFLAAVGAFKADLFVVIAYGKILPRDVLDMPRLGCYNVHFSLLPRWRGASPVVWAVLSGDSQTGLSIMRMDEGLDTGDVLARLPVDITGDDTTPSLFGKLLAAGAPLLVSSLDCIEQGTCSLEKQDDAKATYARILTRDDGCIDWRMSADELCYRVRGLQPWPGAFTFIDGKRLLLHKVSREEGATGPGRIAAADERGILVGTGNGMVRIVELQEEGKRRMAAADYARGKAGLAGRSFEVSG